MEDLLDSVVFIVVVGVILLIISCFIRTTDSVIEINDKLDKIIEVKEKN